MNIELLGGPADGRQLVVPATAREVKIPQLDYRPPTDPVIDSEVPVITVHRYRPSAVPGQWGYVGVGR